MPARRTKSKKGGLSKPSSQGLLGSAELAVPTQTPSKFDPQPFEKYNSVSPATRFMQQTQKQNDNNNGKSAVLQSGGAALLKIAGINISGVDHAVQEVPSFPASTASPVDATYNSQKGAQLAADLAEQRINDSKTNAPAPLGNELKKKSGGRLKRSTRRVQKKRGNPTRRRRPRR